MEGKSHQLPKPANVGGVYMPAPLEAPLRGMPEWPGPPLEHEPEVFEVEFSEQLGELLLRAQALVEGDERVREHFGGRRHVWVGASALDPKGERPASVLVVAFDYERNVAVEVEVHGEGDSLGVIDVKEAAYHPAPSDEEIERATRLAREDRRVAGAFDGGARGERTTCQRRRAGRPAPWDAPHRDRFLRPRGATAAGASACRSRSGTRVGRACG